MQRSSEQQQVFYTPHFNSPSGSGPQKSHSPSESQQASAEPEFQDAVIFDCDGVLVDTEMVKYKAWVEVFKPYGMQLTESDYLPWIGFSSAHIIDGILKAKGLDADTLNLDKTKLRDDKNAIYSELQKKGVDAIPGGVTFLKHMIENKKAYKIKLGIASSASHDQIRESLRQIGVNPNDFDSIVSGNEDLIEYKPADGIRNKPKPFIYQEIAKRLNVDPHRCIVIEDSEAGVVAGADAEMSVLAVPNQFTLNHDFTRATATVSQLDGMTFEN